MDDKMCYTCGEIVEKITHCYGCGLEICTLCLEVVNDDPHCSDCAKGVRHAQRTEEDD